MSTRVHCTACIVLALLPVAAAALPIGGVGVTLHSDFERAVRADLTSVHAEFTDAGDIDGDGAADWHYLGRGDARWSFTSGMLSIGADVAMSTTHVPVQHTGFTARAFGTVTDRVQVWSPTLAPATPLVLQLGLSITGQPWPCDDCTIIGGSDWLPPLGGAWVSVSAPGVPGTLVHSDRHWDSFAFAIDIDALNGVPFDLGISLQLEILADHEEARRRDWDVHSTHGRLDYLNTLTVSALEVSAGGRTVGGAGLYSSDGTQWLPTAVSEPPARPVSEPSAALLLAGGLLALTLRRRAVRREVGAAEE